jgi:hypothetical protein
MRREDAGTCGGTCDSLAGLTADNYRFNVPGIQSLHGPDIRVPPKVIKAVSKPHKVN